MSDTPPGMASSWVDLSREIANGGFTSPLSPRRVTPPLPLGSDTDYMRMLREAQRETSCRSSARVSPITSALMSQSSTCRNSPSCMSPKSPPNSPRTEVADYNEELEGVYINRLKEADHGLTDFMWDWSSKPSICPPKEWKCGPTPGSRSSNSSCSAKSKQNSSPSSSFNKKLAFTFFITNVLSLIIGAGIGIWIYRRADRSIEIVI